jgi:hypothetical protein
MVDQPISGRGVVTQTFADKKTIRFVVGTVVGTVVSTLLVIGAIGFALPNRWEISRSVLIHAAPSEVHRVVSDNSKFPLWALPEAVQTDPSLTSSLTIERSDPQRGVWFATRTRTGEAGHAAVTYRTRAGLTEVTWLDRGELPPVIGGLFRDQFQRQLAAHMERSLTRLKQLAEAPQ